MELYRAHHQWANRPADERFDTLPQLHETVRGYADSAAEATVGWEDMKVQVASYEKDLALVGKAGKPATISNHAFSQLSQRVGAPASYLRTLPAPLAADNLNHGLGLRSEMDSGTDAVLLFHRLGASKDSGLVLRAATTEVYERLWNWEVTERLLELTEKFDLVPATATMSWDGLDHSSDKALYASDHDMFVFLMARNRDVGRAGEDGLYRGLIVANTEVGGISLAVMRFLFRDICQNHIIWGAKDTTEIRIPHRGNLRGKWDGIRASVTQYLDAGTGEEHQLISNTSSFILGKNKEEVLDYLFGKRWLTRKKLEAAYDAVVEDEDGAANTAWGFTQGLTRYSQTVPYADERTGLDRVGRRILELAF